MATDKAERESLRDLRSKAEAEYDPQAERMRQQILKEKKELENLILQSTAYSQFLANNIDTKREEKRSSAGARGGNKDPLVAASPAPTKKGSRKRGRGRASHAEDAEPSSKRSKSDVKHEKEDERYINGERVSPRQPKLITGGVMKEFQLEGFEWLASLYENGANGILADEMGLGKTLQTIAFLSHLMEKDVWGPILVVCPVSTLDNWVTEFKRFAPDLPVVNYYGPPEKRKMIRKANFWKQGSEFPAVVTSYGIVMKDRLALQRVDWKYIVVDEAHRIKNIHCKLVKDLNMYKSLNRLLLTGTPLQNTLDELWSLVNFIMPDLFNDPDKFRNWFNFDDINEREGRDRIITEETKNNVVSKLHQILQPFLLRRLKVDVEQTMPPKREYLISCPMTPLQYEYYQAIRGADLGTRTESGRDSGGENTLVPGTPASNGSGGSAQDVGDSLDGASVVSRPGTPPSAKRKGAKDQHDELLAEATKFLGSKPGSASQVSGRLRTPSKGGKSYAEKEEDDIYDEAIGEDRLGEDEDKELKSLLTRSDSVLAQLKGTELVKQMSLRNRLMQYRKVCQHPYHFDFPVHNPSDPLSEFRIDEQLVRASGKLLVLDRLLPELLRKGHRVLIFSQFKTVLDILEFYAELRKWDFRRIDGETKPEDRSPAIAEFNTDPSIPLFLLTTRAGGLGINLTAADTVVIFDSDWNPQQDLQAQDRVHRIGQQNPVIIYRLVIAGSCEGTILKRANAKRKLEKLVIHERRFKGIRSRSAISSSSSSSSSSTDGKDRLSVQDITSILMDDNTALVEKDQLELKRILENLGPDDPIPEEAILTNEELAALTDRSHEAYENRTGNEGAAAAPMSRIEQINQMPESSDVLPCQTSVSL
ncbi:hypothetical protein GQ54DRAFT_297587 [Martensiomyces pterosporus]|nr:hypothetical protein GQ54DRAFT_297587 [Martensiomyces pterosporus]